MNLLENKENNTSILGGWIKNKDGIFTTAQTPQDFTTPEFNESTKAMRARWNLEEYIKVKFPKLFQKRQKI